MFALPGAARCALASPLWQYVACRDGFVSSTILLCRGVEAVKMANRKSGKNYMALKRWDGEIFAGPAVSEELALKIRPCPGPLAARSRPLYGSMWLVETVLSQALLFFAGASKRSR